MSARPSLADVTRGRGILFGGDYNPEQWPREVWAEDARLMQRAGVNLVTVGVFSWATIEPREGELDLDWLADVLDLLHAGSIAVDLATPTASPPPWLGDRYPETLPVTPEGVRLTYGSRNQFSASSAKYRERALAVTRAVVERFAAHPAVVMWHVGNELGQVDHGPEAAAAFRRWLEDRYGTVEALNAAWATTVWSQRYGSFAEVLPPRAAPYHRNPSQDLDFRRFTSDELLAVYREQVAVIRSYDEERPVTTNFMGFFPLVDYFSWAGDLDLVADDAYPDPDPGTTRSLCDAALTQDLMRSLGGGAPWLLMESATSAVSWRAHNLTKSPERSRLESLQAVAHGADGVCFFQWRAARSGPERFHSGMVPVQGPDTAVHDGVRRLGADLARLAPVVGARTDARVALVWDWPSWWAATAQAMPTDRLDPLATLRSWHGALWDRRVAVDVVPPPAVAADLEAYDVVLAPSLYLLTERAAGALRGFVAGGGTLALGPFSGVADDGAHLHVGRFPVPLRDVLGVSGEEWVPLPEGGVPGTWAGDSSPSLTVETYAEHARTEGAEVLLSLGAAPGASQLEDAVAVARHPYGEGRAWYVGAALDGEALGRVLAEVLTGAGVTGLLPGLPRGVEATRRGDHAFVLNHTDAAVRVGADELAAALDGGVRARGTTTLHELLTGRTFRPGEVVEVPASGVVVVGPGPDSTPAPA